MLRTLGRTANRMLSRLGLELARTSTDLGAFLDDGPHRDAIFKEATKLARGWLDNTTAFDCHPFDVEAEIRGFFDDYLRSPFRASRGGSRFGNLLWLDLLAKAMRPDLILDSGTFKGASAWALKRGWVPARVLSFDIDLSQATRTEGVDYFEQDWTAATLPAARFVLAYFDDHTDQCARLRQSADRGVHVAVFDDDYTIAQMPPMAHGGASLPKLSFAFDDTICDGEAIGWHEGSRHYKWIVNKPELEATRALVRSYDRLPNIGWPFGVDQIPYSVAAL